jgi:hypothetical protein
LSRKGLCHIVTHPFPCVPLGAQVLVSSCGVQVLALFSRSTLREQSDFHFLEKLIEQLDFHFLEKLIEQLGHMSCNHAMSHGSVVQWCSIDFCPASKFAQGALHQPDPLPLSPHEAMPPWLWPLPLLSPYAVGAARLTRSRGPWLRRKMSSPLGSQGAVAEAATPLGLYAPWPRPPQPPFLLLVSLCMRTPMKEKRGDKAK